MTLETAKQLHVHKTSKDVCEDNQFPDELGWCFWDETGGCNGPWQTYADASCALETYITEVLG